MEPRGAVESLERYYDEVWVHGVENFYRPFAELPFILVTVGGGGDGEEVIDWVIATYEADLGMELAAVDCLRAAHGQQPTPRLHGALERIQRHPKLDAILFGTEIKLLMSKATAIVAMCGYNTFCEILSIDKPSLVVPRHRSRQEQLMRAVQAEQLGLLSYIVADESGHDPLRMATAVRALPGQKAPSSVTIPGLLDGLDVICKSFSRAVAADRRNLAIENPRFTKTVV